MKEFSSSEFDGKQKIVSSKWGATTPEMKLYVLRFHLIFLCFLNGDTFVEQLSSEYVL